MDKSVKLTKNSIAMRSKLIITFIFILIANIVFSEDKIDKEKWQEIRDGIHYKKKSTNGKEEFYENWSDEAKKRGRVKDYLKSKPRDRDFLNEKNRSPKKSVSAEWNIPQWTIYLAYVLVGIVLLIVVYLLFFNKNKKKNTKIISVPPEELPIEKPFNELDELLSKSINESNYREAIRIYFIYIIKTLREKGWINWEKKKTNTAYLIELRNRKEYSSFSQVTLIFEIVWYGKREISKEQFGEIKPQFEQLLKSIQSGNE